MNKFLMLLFLLFTSASLAQRSGINTTNPLAELDVNGVIKVANTTLPPQAGMVRWNTVTQDFEGYNGTVWLSLTKSNAPGQFGVPMTPPLVENQQVTSADMQPNDIFGYTVSIDGNYCIIGAWGATIGTNVKQGAAYIFQKSGSNWTQMQKLIASDGLAEDMFGRSVAIKGNYCVVGAHGVDFGTLSKAGAAYVFNLSGGVWSQQSKLVASTPVAGAALGEKVSISGDYCLVGAPLVGNGTAYVFVRSGSIWTQQQQLLASDGASGDVFGFHLSIDGDYCVIGAHKADIGSNTDQGAAYVFLRTGTSWAQQAKIINPSGMSSDLFGSAVSLNGNDLAIGANNSCFITPSVYRPGYVQIFQRSGTSWVFQQQLTAPATQTNDGFGWAVSLSGDYCLVTTPAYDVILDINNYAQNQGLAFLYQRNGSVWQYQSTLRASDGNHAHQFGWTCGISGNSIVVGSSFGQMQKVYMFEKN